MDSNLLVVVCHCPQETPVLLGVTMIDAFLGPLAMYTVIRQFTRTTSVHCAMEKIFAISNVVPIHYSQFGDGSFHLL